MDYTDLYDFQTSTGIIVPNDKAVLLGIQTKFQEIFGTDIDLSAETPVGRLIEAFAVMVKSTLGVTAQTANQFNVNEATGIYLDAVAQIYDLERIVGTKTRIKIKCYFSETADINTVVPAGAFIRGVNIFRIDSDVRFKDAVTDERGTYALGTATALETGPIVAPEGTVNSIQTAVEGWQSVTNIDPTYTGTALETDEAFRKRILASRPIGIGFGTHLISALNRLDGVYSNCVLENNTGNEAMKKGIVLPPHSIYVGLDFITSDALLQDIAQEIARAKPVGTAMVHENVPQATLMTQTVSYGYNDISSQAIYFYKAKPTAVYVNVVYSLGNYTGDNIVNDMTNAIVSYIDTVGVGGKIYGAMISNALITALNIGVSSVLVQKDGGAAAGTTVDMDGYELPYTDSLHIELNESA